jgi:Uncharacterized conserved protein related to C-terminal domain of eukaryotic chaperone, SACSIN
MKVEECFKEGLLRKVEPSADKVKRSLGASKGYIENAKDNLKMKNYGLVIFCAYTSMFHAARAILFRDGVKERSHICIVSYLQEKYPEIKNLANMLDSYRKSRHTSLYSLDYLIDEKDAKEAIKDAEIFMKNIREIVER